MPRLHELEFLERAGMYLSPVETIGHDTSQTSAGSFKRFTQEILLYAPFILEAVLWDVNVSDAYNLELVTSTAASPTILKTLASGVSLTGGGVENTITTLPTLLLPGSHFLSLNCATAHTQRRNGSNRVHFSVFSFISVGYDGASTTVGSIPAKLVGCYYKWQARAL